MEYCIHSLFKSHWGFSFICLLRINLAGNWNFWQSGHASWRNLILLFSFFNSSSPNTPRSRYDGKWTRRSECCVCFLALNLAYVRNCRGLPSVRQIALDIEFLAPTGRKKYVMLRLLDAIFSHIFLLQWPMDTMNCRCLVKHTSSIQTFFLTWFSAIILKRPIRNQSIFRYHYYFWAF